jgi:hypothetical protein
MRSGRVSIACRCTDARKNIAKPVTTCHHQSVVSACFIVPTWSRNARYWP